MKFQLRFFYLDQKQQRLPCLLFNLFLTGESLASAGDKVVAVFPEGWTRTPTVQSFSYDNGAGGGAVEAYPVGFASQLDDQGLVQIVKGDWTPPSGPSINSYYRWNGQAFVFVHEEEEEQTPFEP